MTFVPRITRFPLPDSHFALTLFNSVVDPILHKLISFFLKRGLDGRGYLEAILIPFRQRALHV